MTENISENMKTDHAMLRDTEGVRGARTRADSREGKCDSAVWKHPPEDAVNVRQAVRKSKW